MQQTFCTYGLINTLFINIMGGQDLGLRALIDVSKKLNQISCSSASSKLISHQFRVAFEVAKLRKKGWNAVKCKGWFSVLSLPELSSYVMQTTCWKL